MTTRKTGGGKNPPRNNGRFAKASEEKTSDPHNGHSEEVEYQTKGVSTSSKTTLVLIVIIVVSVFILCLFFLVKGLNKTDEKSDSDKDNHQETTQMTADQMTVTAEEVAQFENEIVTSDNFFVTHKGTRVLWRMRDGNGVLRPVKTRITASEYTVTGYEVSGKVAVPAWTRVGGGDRVINTPTCDIMFFQLTDNAKEDSVLLVAEPDMTQSLDRTGRITPTEVELLEGPDPQQGEQVAEVEPAPKANGDIPKGTGKW